MRAFETELAELAAHLAFRRNAILETWRMVLKTDPALTKPNSLTKAQLNDHIPALLIIFEQRLNPLVHFGKQAEPGSLREVAAAHGLHRRQQGWDPREVSRELGRLNECMVIELDNYAMTHPGLAQRAMAHAQRAWAELCSIAISESIAQYFRLQQLEAAGYLWDLDTALEHIRELEKQRADLWHQAVHDIRGNLGVVVTAAAGLNMPMPEQVRTKFLRSLDRNVTSLQQLLEDVMNLARLHADKELRQLSRVDVAGMIRELCEGLQPQAEQRGLSLKYDGPSTLVVESDGVKIRRVAQNLVLNALKYTVQGGVTVGLRDGLRGDNDHWMLSVHDTGPGLHSGSNAPRAQALEEAAERARETDTDASDSVISGFDEVTEAAQVDPDAHPAQPQQGEGIGLLIVKRLTALLDAGIEIDSRPATGTTFRVLFPRKYVA